MSRGARIAQVLGVAALAVVAVATATVSAPPHAVQSYILDNATPSHDFGPSFVAKMKPAAAFPGPVSGVLLPPEWAAMVMGEQRPIARFGRRIVLGRGAPNDLDEFYAWLGLSKVTLSGGQQVTVGADPVPTEWGPTLTFGCATCHSQNFFGTLVYGMSAKTPRAYDLMDRAKQYLQNAPRWVLGASDADQAALLQRAQQSFRSIGVQRPQALGLDTTVALVSLSLAHREANGAASISPTYSSQPRPDFFDTARADSKPMDWWSVNYKTRFLADGALTSGDIIITNFLWNEIGRGTDLNALAAWIKANPGVVADLNKMVRSAVPPRIGDFVQNAIDVPAAKRGEAIYVANCAVCHGSYDKNWAAGTATVKVNYPKPTRVFDVDTDPDRATGTAAIAPRLNALDISTKYKLVVQPTGGYVAPPLLGVWSRYPYLHNRSVPNLCELLTPAAQRVTRYFVGTTDNIATDFDAQCVGYPTNNVPLSWQTRDRVFDTGKEGLSNAGHDIFVNAADKDKRDLIEYLKTL